MAKSVKPSLIENRPLSHMFNRICKSFIRLVAVICLFFSVNFCFVNYVQAEIDWDGFYRAFDNFDFNLTAKDVPNDDGGAIELTWKKFDRDEIIGYVVNRYTQKTGDKYSGYQVACDISSKETLSCIDSTIKFAQGNDIPLINNQTYYYYIEPKLSNGTTWYYLDKTNPLRSTSGTPLDNLGPDKPAYIKVRLDSGAVEVYWQKSEATDFKQYILNISDEQSYDKEPIYQEIIDKKEITFKELKLSDGILSENQNYYAYVQVMDVYNNVSEKSDIKSFVMPGVKIYQPPRPKTADVVFTVLFWGLIVLLPIWIIYIIVRDLRNKIRRKKEKANKD